MAWRLRIPGREVVLGDVLVLHEGDRIAADAVLLDGHLDVNESLLTGEAVPVTKLPAGADDRCSPAPWSPRASAWPGYRRLPPPRRSATSARRWPRPPRRCPGLQRASRRLIRQLTIGGLVLAVATACSTGCGTAMACSRACWPASRWHGDPAGGDPGDPHRVPGAGRLAHCAAQGAGAARFRGRDARRDLGAGGGQDRHADAEPHAGGASWASPGSSFHDATRPSCRSASTRWSSSPCWPRRPTRSTRWKRRSSSSAALAGGHRAHPCRAGRRRPSTACRPTSWR